MKPLFVIATMLLALISTHSTTVHAIIIGEIKLLSHFSEPLHAQIPLNNASESELASLSVSLQNKQYYKSQKLDWNPVYKTLKLYIQIVNHQPYIVIRSTQKIRDLMLSFILNIEWQKGKKLQTFDMLIRRHSKHAPTKTENQNPDNQIYQTIPTQLMYIKENQFVYGPTTENDELKDIVAEFKKATQRSLYEIKSQLVKNNPHAFSVNNKLKTGFYLKINLKPVDNSSFNSKDFSEKETIEQLNREIHQTNRLIFQYQNRNLALRKKLQDLENEVGRQIKIAEGK